MSFIRSKIIGLIITLNIKLISDSIIPKTFLIDTGSQVSLMSISNLIVENTERCITIEGITGNTIIAAPMACIILYRSKQIVATFYIALNIINLIGIDIIPTIYNTHIKSLSTTKFITSLAAIEIPPVILPTPTQNIHSSVPTERRTPKYHHKGYTKIVR